MYLVKSLVCENLKYLLNEVVDLMCNNFEYLTVGFSVPREDRNNLTSSHLRSPSAIRAPRITIKTKTKNAHEYSIVLCLQKY